MFFSRFIYVSAIFLIFIGFLNFDTSNAQVGGLPACTNFTCRYGECEQFSVGFSCHCLPGVKGENCDHLMQSGEDACLSSPCWNGGTCHNLGSDFSCDCPSGKSGKNCRTIASAPCLTQNPCQNNAVCQVDSVNGYYCFCVGYWTGQFCESPIPLCSRPTPCYNGGSCVNNVCQCPRNFTGSYCETYSPVSSDKVIKILNKAWYIANMRVTYYLYNGLVKEPVTQTGTISAGQDYAFYIPFEVDYEGSTGAVLTIDAVAGVQVLSLRIHSDPECFHIWGTTLYPAWTHVNC